MKNTQQYLGINYSNHFIRIAVFDPDSMQVIAAREFRRERDEKTGEKDEMASFLTEWGRNRMVIISPPAVETYAIYNELPLLKKEETETALKSFLRKGYNFEDKDYSTIYNEVSPAHSEDPQKIGYYVAAIPNKYLERDALGDEYNEIRIDHLELAYIAYLRWLLWEKPQLGDGVHAAVHFAPDEILFVSFKRGNPITTRALFSNILKLDDWQKGNLKNIEDYEVFVSHLAKKLQRFISYTQYRKFSGEMPIEDIIITGMNAGNEHIGGHISDLLGIPVRGFTRHRARSPMEDGNEILNQRWAVATGLSMKSLGVKK